ncbi:hypothetical protein [Candidatus Thiodictyon syntrophicum]|jgi:hypothetical protein|uniref:Uncharacterized protein n=1 Tax=Candidatus Thiodictyon syntrophicum TaxID=1166950 RepID=A0A2K8U2H0_9GAMM|nr:hypothetical protein [Candidatus Thiodictyon syntrophicum]AUB79780.1 hypothetical protein THSYN_01600 [Candidatus Thiodictyon syntrophicum]
MEVDFEAMPLAPRYRAPDLSMRHQAVIEQPTGSAAPQFGAISHEELIGHYVNYLKVFAAAAPPADFWLYAVTTRRPRGLFGQTEVVAVKEGVYRLPVVSRSVSIILELVQELPPEDRLRGLPIEELLRGLDDAGACPAQGTPGRSGDCRPESLGPRRTEP